jgi:hypothetical protein
MEVKRFEVGSIKLEIVLRFGIDLRGALGLCELVHNGTDLAL